MAINIKINAITSIDRIASVTTADIADRRGCELHAKMVEPIIVANSAGAMSGLKPAENIARYI